MLEPYHQKRGHSRRLSFEYARPCRISGTVGAMALWGCPASVSRQVSELLCSVVASASLLGLGHIADECPPSSTKPRRTQDNACVREARQRVVQASSRSCPLRTNSIENWSLHRTIADCPHPNDSRIAETFKSLRISGTREFGQFRKYKTKNIAVGTAVAGDGPYIKDYFIWLLPRVDREIVCPDKDGRCGKARDEAAQYAAFAPMSNDDDHADCDEYVQPVSSELPCQ